MSGLRRTLGLSSTIAIVAGGIIGSGVFMKPALMMSQLGSPVWLLEVWALAGIITPEKGSIQIRGTVAPLLAIGAGLEHELSGYDNIRIMGTLIGLRGKELKESVQTIKNFSELSHDDLSMQIKRYSAGMMARLAFSISVCRIPDILIVDEALSVGDQGFQEKCAHRINEMKAAGTTIIY
ncbi:MAG: hypothetical protein ACK5PO_08770, partial [Bacteroidota bacterium]